MCSAAAENSVALFGGGLLAWSQAASDSSSRALVSVDSRQPARTGPVRFSASHRPPLADRNRVSITMITSIAGRLPAMRAQVRVEVPGGQELLGRLPAAGV